MESSPALTLQITSCQMFVSRSGPSRHNIHFERIVPEDVESQPVKSCQIDKACQVSETRETVGTSV